MNEVLRNIATQIGAAHLIFNKSALTRENCRADLTGLPADRVVVDMDLMFPSGQYGQKQCDYVLFFLNTAQDTCLTVPMELKGGAIRGVVEQLQQGVDFAGRYVPRGYKVICLPILFHKGIPTLAHRALQKRKVRFRGLKMTVETTRCDTNRNLVAVLPKWSLD